MTPRRPAHLPPWRDMVWAALRAAHAEGRDCDAPRLARQAHTAPGEVLAYLRALQAAGIAVQADAPAAAGRSRAAASFGLLRDPGPAAPVLRADGTPRTETATERLWRTARMLRTFGARDLALNASIPGAPVPERAAAEFARALARGRLAAALPDGVGPRAWRLIGTPGPRAPIVRKSGAVIDPNTGRSAGAFRGRAAHG